MIGFIFAGTLTGSGPAEGQTASLFLPPSLFRGIGTNDTEIGLFFSFYTTQFLFPLANKQNSTALTVSPVVGGSVTGQTIMDLIEPITITLQLVNEVLVVCVCVCVYVCVCVCVCVCDHCINCPFM